MLKIKEINKCIKRIFSSFILSWNLWNQRDKNRKVPLINVIPDNLMQLKN